MQTSSTFNADLPVDGKYNEMEIAAPDGYVTSGEKQEFTFNCEGSDKDFVSPMVEFSTVKVGLFWLLEEKILINTGL